MRARFALSRSLIALSLLALGACGGGGTTDVTPAPPPPTPVATSVAIQSGDGQQSEPGQAVSTNPSVIVRDQNGAVMAGVTVVFAVDSGGGSLATTSSVTGTNGVATSGTWTLGTTEGRNVLRATAATLPALKIVATARVAAATINPVTVPTSGGTVTITQAGSQLNGATLTIPSGALTAAGNIGFTLSSPSSVPLPSGMMAINPALSITGSVGALKQPASLYLPVTTPAGKVVVVAGYNPSTGGFSVLPSSARGAAGITVSLASLDASSLSSAVASSSRAAIGASVRASDPVLVTIALDPALLAPDFDSNFRPGVDDWDFRRQPIVAIPETPADPIIDPATPMIASSIWYFVNKKNSNGKLWQQFQDAKPVPESNRRGLRWAAVAYPDFPNLYTPGGLAVSTRKAYNGDPANTAQQEMYDLKAAFLLSSRKPQPIFVFTVNNTVVDSLPRYGIAYRTVGNAVDLALPDAPGETFRITLSANGWTPVTVPVQTGTYTVDFIAPIQYGIFVRDASLSAQFAQVQSKTIGESVNWPKPALKSKFGALDTLGVYLLDPLQHWWECAACPDHGFRSSNVTPSPSNMMLNRFSSQNGDGTWTALGGIFASNNFSVASIPGTATSRLAGFAVYQPSIGSGLDVAARPAWLDWVTVNYKKLPVDMVVDSVVTFKDTTVAFTLSAPTAPSGVTFRWKYRGRVTDSTDTGTPAFSRRMKEYGRAMMYGTVLEPTTKRPIGRDSSAIIYAHAWKFTAVALASVTPPPGGFGSENADTQVQSLVNTTLTALNSQPADGRLMLLTDPTGCQASFMEQFAPGTAIDSGSVPSAFRAFLGSNCVDPDFISTLTVGRYGSGTIVGSVVPSNADPDVLVVPGGSINATMNGNVLQGTFVWRARYSTGIALYTINFQAVLSQPPAIP